MRTCGASGISAGPRATRSTRRGARRAPRHRPGSDLVGRRPAFGVEAREPGRDVGQRIARTGEVPVDQHGAAVADAEVVAPRRRSAGARRRRAARSRWRSGGSGSAASSHAASRAATRGTVPGRPRSRSSLGSRTGCRPRSGRSGGGAVAATSARHARTASTSSGSHGGGQWASERSSSDDHRAFPVVVPAEHRRQERRAAHLRVEKMLIADPRRRVVAPRRLHERGRAVGELHEPVRGVRLSPTGDLTPCDAGLCSAPARSEPPRPSAAPPWRRSLPVARLGSIPP